MKIAAFVAVAVLVVGVSCSEPPVAPQYPVMPPPTPPQPVKPKVPTTPKKRKVKPVTPEPEVVLPLRPAQVGARHNNIR